MNLSTSGRRFIKISRHFFFRLGYQKTNAYHYSYKNSYTKIIHAIIFLCESMNFSTSGRRFIKIPEHFFYFRISENKCISFVINKLPYLHTSCLQLPCESMNLSTSLLRFINISRYFSAKDNRKQNGLRVIVKKFHAGGNLNFHTNSISMLILVSMWIDELVFEPWVYICINIG